MSKRKRIVWGFAALGALLVVGLAATFIIVGGMGQSALEKWIGDELKSVIADHLKPELKFESLDIQGTDTVVLTGVKLVADDPDNPGQKVNIIVAETLKIRLAKMPSKGEPLYFRDIVFEDATIRLVDTEAGGLLGFSDMTRSTDEKPEDPAPLSSVLQIEKIEIKNAAIEYDTREKDIEKMRFDQIDTVVNIDPSQGSVYGLDLAIKRENIADINLKGALDLDTMELALSKLDVGLRLAREYDRYLPPAVQKFIKEHDLTGNLSVTGQGTLVLEDIDASDVSLKVKLAEALGSVAGYRLPIKSLAFKARLKDRQVGLTELAGELLGGAIIGEGKLSLNKAMDADFTIGLAAIELGQLVEVDKETGTKPIAGKLDLQLNVKAPLGEGAGKLNGQGQMMLSEGKIGRLPVLSPIMEFFKSTAKLEAVEITKGQDTANVYFKLCEDHAFIEKALVQGSWFDLAAAGKVYYNQRVALHVRGGPLKKFLSNTGVAGRLAAKFTDGMLTYRVDGSLGKINTPKPIPLTGHFGPPGDGEDCGTPPKPVENPAGEKGDEGAEDKAQDKPDDKPDDKEND